MERGRRVLRVLLLSLCAALALTGAAWAADGYSIRGVDVNRENGAATVALTAEGDCILWAAVYDGDGQFVSFASESVTGAEGEQEKTVSFPGGIAEDTSVSAFLSSAGNTPLCEKGIGYDGNVYAILYDDGTMIFQHSDTAESGKTVLETWAIDLAGYTWEWYSEGQGHPTTPWHNFRESITHIAFRDVIKPLSTAYWFRELSNLTSVNLKNLDTSHIIDMSDMFHSCSSLTTLDVSGFNTENVTDMNSMFAWCSSLTSLDVSGFNTEKVTNMSYMFAWCSNLTSLDVSGFTDNSTEMWQMFFDCSSLKTIYASDSFSTGQVEYSSDMFSNCTSLIGSSGTRYDPDHTGGEYARIDNPPDAPGYFTYKAAPGTA